MCNKTIQQAKTQQDKNSTESKSHKQEQEEQE